MRAATAVGATAILILVTQVWACPAGAENAIKPGKWEFWIVGSKIPEPSPGTELPPGVRWGPEGMITSVCISETNLKAPHSHVRTSVPRHGDLLPALKTRLGKGSCNSMRPLMRPLPRKAGQRTARGRRATSPTYKGLCNFMATHSTGRRRAATAPSIARRQNLHPP